MVTHFLVVSDQNQSREFYRTVSGRRWWWNATRVIMKVANGWLILNALRRLPRAALAVLASVALK